MIFPSTIAAPDTAAHAAQSGQDVLSWSVHLIKRRPARLPLIGASLLGTFAAALAVFHSLWPALPLMLVLLLSLSEFLFPVRYTLSTQSATARHGLTMLEIRWADVRHAYLTEDGIKLSPLQTKNSRFEPLRGVYLRFNDSNRDKVIDAVKRLRAEAISHG